MRDVLTGAGEARPEVAVTADAPLLDTLVELQPAAAGVAAGEMTSATVLSLAPDAADAELAIAGVACRAAIAVSCLIRPLPGDRVLAYRSAAEVFVLAVLERSGPNYGTLALPGNGNLAVEGETLSLVSRQRLALKADTLDVQAKALAFVAEKTHWIGKALTTIVERWHSSARTHEVSADSLTVKAVNRVTIVDQLDSLRAETQSTRIAGVASETAQSKVVAVAEDLRMDGKRISMG